MNNEWLDLVKEEAIEQDLPIIDTCHHIWEYSPYYPPFNGEAMMKLKSESGHNIVKTVLEQAQVHYREDRPEHLKVVGETEFNDKVANESEKRGGREAGVCSVILGHVNLCLDSGLVGEALDAHIAASKRFRGIRYMTAFDFELPHGNGYDTLPGVMISSEFIRSFKELVDRDLTFDARVFQHQMLEVYVLAKKYPNARIVLTHSGHPLVAGRYASRREEAFVEWKRQMSIVAECPNVYAKIGTLNWEPAGLSAAGRERPFTSDEMAAVHRDYILTMIDLFGPSRCMFESNFPVDGHTTTYTVLWNCYKKVTKDFTEGERADLFYNTAAKFYRI